MKNIYIAAAGILALILISVLAFMTLSGNKTVVEDKNIQNEPHFQTSNPDYVNNSSTYLVDYDGKVSSDIPLGRALWVEEIVDHHSLKVSYAVDRVGMRILDFKTLHIPGLSEQPGMPPVFLSDLWNTGQAGKCWTTGAVSFLKSNLLHKVVYLVQVDPYAGDPHPLAQSLDSAGYMLQIEDGTEETLDAAAFLIASGHGTAPYYREQGYAYPPTLKKELRKIQEVADLASSGLWKTCPRLPAS